MEIVVYDLKGKYINRLTGAHYPSGHFSVNWDGISEDGSPVPSGLYIYELRTSNFRDISKMLLLK